VRVLIVHNHYKQPGGEDVGVQDESSLLTSHGHQVQLLEASNDHIVGLPVQIRTAVNAVYSLPAKRRMTLALSKFQPNIVHVHNFFPVFSPSIYYACDEANVPVVQTLHNYRLLCPCGTFFRDDHVCEDCMTKTVAWPGVLHGCYRGSRIGTAAVATMTFVHRVLRTFERRVQTLIVLTEFARQKFIEGGLPEDKLVVKAPFVDVDPGIGRGHGNYVLFVGRLTKEKGIVTLLRAWEVLGTRIRLRIAGDGPLKDYVQTCESACHGVEFLGYRSRSEINRLMREARALVFPSLWYEGVPRTILESFATATPVITSKIGSIGGIVAHGRTGLHFVPGDVASLTQQIEWMLDHPCEWDAMRQYARAEYEANYTAEPNYQALMRIYEGVLTRRFVKSEAPAKQEETSVV
jgi:glycosyltransferase involved in cell wall biosynthesis